MSQNSYVIIYRFGHHHGEIYFQDLQAALESIKIMKDFDKLVLLPLDYMAVFRLNEYEKNGYLPGPPAPRENTENIILYDTKDNKSC